MRNCCSDINFNYNLIYLISPIFKFQATQVLTSQQCLKTKNLSTNAEIYLDELYEKLIRVCLPFYIYTKTLPTLTARLECTEKRV